MVPQKDLDGLRSSLDKQITAAKRQAEQYQQQLQMEQMQRQVDNRAFEYYQQYLAEGQSGAEAWQAAQYYAREDYTQQNDQQAIVQDAERYRSSVAQRQFTQQLVAFKDEVVQETGLSEDELQAATEHLNPSGNPRFVSEVWKAATAAALQKAKAAQMPADPNAEHRALRNGLPVPGGGAAGGANLGRPANMSRRSPEYRQWLVKLQQQEEYSNRQR
jgi:hypothetical protein